VICAELGGRPSARLTDNVTGGSARVHSPVPQLRVGRIADKVANPHESGAIPARLAPLYALFVPNERNVNRLIKLGFDERAMFASAAAAVPCRRHRFEVGGHFGGVDGFAASMPAARPYRAIVSRRWPVCAATTILTARRQLSWPLGRRLQYTARLSDTGCIPSFRRRSSLKLS